MTKFVIPPLIWIGQSARSPFGWFHIWADKSTGGYAKFLPSGDGGPQIMHAVGDIELINWCNAIHDAKMREWLMEWND